MGDKDGNLMHTADYCIVAVSYNFTLPFMKSQQQKRHKMFSSVIVRSITYQHCLFCSLFTVTRSRSVSELHFSVVYLSQLSRAELNCGTTGDDATYVILKIIILVRVEFSGYEYVCFCELSLS